MINGVLEFRGGAWLWGLVIRLVVELVVVFVVVVVVGFSTGVNVSLSGEY